MSTNHAIVKIVEFIFQQTIFGVRHCRTQVNRISFQPNIRQKWEEQMPTMLGQIPEGVLQEVKKSKNNLFLLSTGCPRKKNYILFFYFGPLLKFLTFGHLGPFWRLLPFWTLGPVETLLDIWTLLDTWTNRQMVTRFLYGVTYMRGLHMIEPGSEKVLLKRSGVHIAQW